MSLVIAAVLTDTELILLTVLFGITILLSAAFLAYAIFNSTLEQIRDSGVLSLLVQFTTTALIAYGLILLMAASVIEAAAGLPALTGLVGFLLGKAPAAAKSPPS
jgi:hypothetical protein